MRMHVQVVVFVALWHWVRLVRAFQLSFPPARTCSTSTSCGSAAESSAESSATSNPSAPTSPPSTSTCSGTNARRVKPIPYIATTSTIEHSRALSQYIRQGDRVLELGTQLDSCTETIREAIGDAGHGVFVDVKRTETTSGRSGQGSRDPNMFQDSGENIKYVELEQFSYFRTVLDDNVESPFDVLVLDVTAMLGNDLELAALSVIFEFVDDMTRRGKQRPRVVIVKSKTIASLSRRLVHAQRLFDGTVTRDFKSPSRDGRPYIIAGVGVEDYRRTIPYVVQDSDECLEVGCFSGTTTQLVDDASSYCIGVDIGPKIIKRAKKEHPDIYFAVGDAWRLLDMLRIKRDAAASRDSATPISTESILRGFDVIYADIGGLSGPDGTLESLSLIDGLSYALEPRCVVIKSLCMRRLASSLRAYSDIWEKGDNRSTRSSTFVAS